MLINIVTSNYAQEQLSHENTNNTQKVYETSDNQQIYVYRWDSLFLAQKYHESILYIQSDTALSLAEKKYRIAANYARMQMVDSAHCYLDNYIDVSMDDRLIIVDRNWDLLREDTLRWQSITRKIEDLYLKELSSGVNKELALELFYMGILDQKYRVYLPSLQQISELNDSIEIRLELDEALFLHNRIEAIITEYGFPTISLVGNLASMHAFYILQHSPHIAKFYRLIQQTYQKGEIEPIWYAMLTDRWLMRQNKKQLYGSQFMQSTKSEKRFPGKTVLWPVKDFENVNQRRKEMGFPTTVEENTKRFGNGYIPPEYYQGKGKVRWYFKIY